MNKARMLVQLLDPLMITLVGKHRSVEAHHDLPSTPLKRVADLDVELDIPSQAISLNGKALCVHARRVEERVAEGYEVKTERCRNTASSTSPNGYLCSYHQRFLAPVWEGTYIPPVSHSSWASSILDLNKALPLIRDEVASARAMLADNEFVDHKTFEKLKNVEIDTEWVRRYLAKV